MFKDTPKGLLDAVTNIVKQDSQKFAAEQKAAAEKHAAKKLKELPQGKADEPVVDGATKVAEAIDPVKLKELEKKFSARTDKDINNDGKVDSSDEYLHSRRKAIKKAMKEESLSEALVDHMSAHHTHATSFEGHMDAVEKAPHDSPVQDAHWKAATAHKKAADAHYTAHLASQSYDPEYTEHKEKALEASKKAGVASTNAHMSQKANYESVEYVTEGMGKEESEKLVSSLEAHAEKHGKGQVQHRNEYGVEHPISVHKREDGTKSYHFNNMGYSREGLVNHVAKGSHSQDEKGNKVHHSSYSKNTAAVWEALNFKLPKTDRGDKFQADQAQQRRDMNAKNDPGAAKKGYALSVLDQDKARSKAKKKGVKVDPFKSSGGFDHNKGKYVYDRHGRLPEGVEFAEASTVNGVERKPTDLVWKQTGLSHEDAVKKHGKDNVKTKKGGLRNGQDYVQVRVPMGEGLDTPGNSEHQCAIHVKSEQYGEGRTLTSQHAEPTAEGFVEWYDVMFAEGIKRVYTKDIEVLVSESHMNHKKAKKAK